MKIILISISMIILLVFTGKDRLTGRWESKSKTGNITGVIFTPDNTFEGYINKKPFVTGTYTLEDEVFSFQDNGCKDMKGVYKINFYSNSDSMRLEHINDSCIERRKGMLNLALGRVDN